ncbi:alanine--tRNA ligase [Limosilactobacillus reuteri]|uniref:Alanine--tRNA ligase n=3 Tax=Limosilactobacillus reuteri TaxID=1598 RepID=A0A1V4FMK9_LIMRT|nr:alanine--tRNA ligase [Limosilactobacillus reuteri]CCC04231.1 alanyl-tRNA synthase [Limosilactobacillus reuteri subsp. suis]AGN99592.1 alanyl-tRNA synthase [Limosilactobacillus reuteri I5007]AMY13567.1 alanine--tRNA ligase [Limosilactobacillus reuteri]MCC4340834.1 alanine--tRNA ligase [Limosilactobacillus reuteri]MCC4349910.1 alanine--tRNA ligase [Limosilactobacillus reuteri]
MKELKKLNSAQVRRMYLKFFEEHGHQVMPSASLVPVNDPTLLWINSGVATMKKYFDGKVVPDNPRMTSSQKSIRTNDIENVGKTARHHTMFEMLGNFSVGDYFKNEVIPWAWELLTSDEWFGFDPERLYITYYPKDHDAYNRWREVGVAEDHLIADEDNFWDIGQGPSGPDTEIFYDRGQEFNNLADDDPENYPGGENERYLEIWNIVFSQFNHTPEDTYEPLPHKNIDTGMGLERVVSIFENAPTNFETDLFMPLIKQAEEFSGTKKYGQNKEDDIQFKIIADHIRTITFAIGDGALPSNVGRGYVIRRLLRRAVVAGKKLGIDEPFLAKMVPTVGKIMEDYYPDVLKNADYIASVIESEEDRFSATLNGGLNLLNNVIAEAKENKTNEIDGRTAFKLYDTYGFPIELTKEYAEDEGLTVDEKGFQAAMTEQQNRARNARDMDNGMGVQTDLWTSFKEDSKYVGYTDLAVDNAKVIGLAHDGQQADEAQPGDKNIELIFDVTPFYAEMGGQVADTGDIIDNYGKKVGRVVDVQHAPNQQNLHRVELTTPIKKGARYKLVVDRIRHLKIEKNHTATHLLDQALRNVLGGHTQQAGSLVEEHYLRFDFNHFGQVTAEDLKKVENMVNEQIWKEIPVKTVETDIDSAKEMGAIALFSDKYGDKVRVVKIGDFNTEFCGGDHVKNTNELGLFKIVSEGGVGAGVRRIEAVTSSDAFKFFQDRDDLLTKSAASLKVAQIKEVPHQVETLQNELKEAQKQNESLQAKIAAQQANNVFENVQATKNGSLIAAEVQVAGMGQLRQLADTWRSKALSDVLVLATASDGKANLLVAVSDDKTKEGLKAGDLIKAIAPAINGGGGGRPNLAQAGGKNPAGIKDALDQAKNYLDK